MDDFTSSDSTDLTLYSKAQLESARNRGQLVGWIQGGGAVIAAAVLWNLLGWIPVLLGVGVVGYVLYKLMSDSDKE